MQSVYAAWAKGDYRAIYAFESPRLRDVMPYEKWLKDSGLDRPETEADVRFTGGRLAEVCPCVLYERVDYPKTLRCTLISEVTVEQDHQTKTQRLYEMWEYVDGEWFHGITADESPDGCGD